MKLFINGEIYTKQGMKEAFVLEGNHFVDVGKQEQLLTLYPEAEKVDLQGKFVCAGFNDSHMHTVSYGQSLTTIALGSHCKSLAGLKAYVKQEIEKRDITPGSWVRGRGWNQDFFQDEVRFLTRYDLDEISTEHPICLTRACGHACVVNSLALEMLGIDKNTKQVPGGHFDLDDNNEPLGIFREKASQLITRRIPQPNKEQTKQIILGAMKKMNAYGITSVQSDDFGALSGVGYHQIIEAFKELREENKMTVRVNEQCRFADVEQFKKFIEERKNAEQDEFFKFGPLKLMGDGSLGARTALMSVPYADDPSTCGIAVATQEFMDEMIDLANVNKIPVAVHVIGDGILDVVLDATEKALKKSPNEDHRHGIVHCQITREEQLKRMAELNMHCYAQTIFLDYDSSIVEARVGKDRASTSYNFKTLMDLGVTVSNGSDAPVENPDVLAGIQCAVTRCPLQMQREPYLESQKMTVEEALDSFTSAGAKASFEEAIKGNIQKDMLADFVILNKNPIECDPYQIKEINVLQTWVDGRLVYTNN